MGEIADMILDGLLDEETGEYIGDENMEMFGDEAPGFPVSYSGGYKNPKRKRGGKKGLNRYLQKRIKGYKNAYLTDYLRGFDDYMGKPIDEKVPHKRKELLIGLAQTHFAQWVKFLKDHGHIK